MKACCLALGVSLRCLMAVPANSLKLPATDDPGFSMWPNHDQMEHCKHAMEEWQKDEIMKHGVREGLQCYKACCGLGHRNRRTLMQAVQAWSRGQTLSVVWTGCNGTNGWNLGQDEHTRNEYKRWISADVSPNDFDKQECQAKISNEPEFDDDSKQTLLALYKGVEETRLMHPAVKWYYALQQIGIAKSPMGSIASRFIQQEFRGHGASIIGVHLRLGNGEEAAIKANRPPTTPQQEVFKYVSQTADRIAKEVLDVSPDNIRIFVASDSHSAVEEFQRFDARVFFFSGGTWLHEGQGVSTAALGSTWDQDEACLDLEGTVMLETVLLGYTDVLLTPQWSELTAISKNLALSRGAHWCENQQWLSNSGNIPDPASADVYADVARVNSESEDTASAMQEWEAILNGCPAEKCTQGYRCYYEQGHQSRLIAL